MQRVMSVCDQRPDVLVPHHPLALGEPRGVTAIAQRHILQLALAALIADRAIQRMIDQQEFHGPFLGGGALGDSVKTFMPSITGVAQAGIHLGARLDLDQTHPAIGGDRQLSCDSRTGGSRCRPHR
jgi:hypothetical protein